VAIETEKVRAIAERVAKDLGLEVADVEFRGGAGKGGRLLRVYIEKAGAAQGGNTPDEMVRYGVTHSDCEAVSREMSTILDVEDVVPGGSYLLEVSSPGLDRPLRQLDDYRRFAGRRAKLVVRQPIDGQGFFKGRLGGVDGDVVLIDGDDGRQHRVPVGAISRANLEVEF